MSRALQLHDATIDEAVTAAGGRMLKARGEGDSTFSVFARPTEAVRAAVAARRALETGDWPAGGRLAVRFAIHVGEVESRDGEYYGTAVNRAARIRGLAAGGQILVSQAVAEVVIDHLPEGVSLAELGEQELRGLSRPERICAVVDARRPIREAIGGLCPYKGLLAYQPEDDDIFFGREAQTADLLGRLLDRHFVVVVGASGSGKSSLVRAGVLAAIRRGEVPGSASWSVVIVTPGEDPATDLTTELQKPGLRAPRESSSRSTKWRSCSPYAATRPSALASSTCCSTPWKKATAPSWPSARCGPTSTDTVRRFLASRVRSRTRTSCWGQWTSDELRRAIEAPAEVAGLSVETGLVDVILRDLAREPGSLPLLSHALLETWQRRIGTTLTLAGYHDSGGVRGAIARTAETAWTESLTEQQRPIARRIFLRLTELGEGTEDTRRRVARTELVSGADADAVDEVLRDLADRRLITVDDGTVEVAHEALIREWPRLRGWLDDDREGLRTHRHLTHAAEDWNALGRDASELYRGPRLQATREWLDRDPSAQLNELETDFFDASAEQERTERAEEANGSRPANAPTGGCASCSSRRRSRSSSRSGRVRWPSLSAAAPTARPTVPARCRSPPRSTAPLPRYRSCSIATGASRCCSRCRRNASALTRRRTSALFAALVDEPRLRSTAWGGHDGYAWMEPLRPNQVVALGRQGADVWDLDARTKSSVPSTYRRQRRAWRSVPTVRSLQPEAVRAPLASGMPRPCRPSATPIDAGEPVTDVAFTPDGEHVAVAVGGVKSLDAITPATTTYLWDVSTRQRSSIALAGHEASVNALAVSPDGQLLAAGDNDGRVVFHDPTTGEPVGAAVQVGPDEGILGIAFSPDGRRLGIGTFALSGLGRGHVADVASRTEIAQFGTGTLLYVGFTEDSSEFVTWVKASRFGTSSEKSGSDNRSRRSTGPPKSRAPALVWC